MTTAAASPPVRRGTLQISRDDLQAAVAANILTDEQADRLWTACGERASHRPTFDAAHVAYFAGAEPPDRVA